MALKGVRLPMASSMAPARDDFLRLGAMAEDALKNAVKALHNRDEVLARRVAGDDQKIDDLEAAIENRVLRLIALHGPMLQDLREAAFLLKAITDLERIGDLSTKIARNVADLTKWPPLKQSSEVVYMGESASAMLKEVLDAFINGNEEKAHKACQRDEAIDEVYRRLLRELLSLMEQNPERVPQANHLMVISQSLERIGDHTTNLGERTIYVLTGNKIHY